MAKSKKEKEKEKEEKYERDRQLRRNVCNGRVPKDGGEYNRWYNDYMAEKAWEKEQMERRKYCLHTQTTYDEKTGRLKCIYCGKLGD
jgi:hypothetical protein